MPDPKLQKLQDLLKILNDGISNDDFVTAFKAVLAQVAKVEDALIQKLDTRLGKITDGKDGRDGRDGKNIKGDKGEPGAIGRAIFGGKGEPGNAGANGSPDTPTEVRDKLESLPDGEKQSIQSIQDLPKMLEEIGQRISSSRSGAGLISVRTRFVDDETMTGAVNGSNTAFTISRSPVTGSLKVYVNGSRMRVTEDYTLSDKTITFTTAPPTNSILLTDFRY